VTTFFGGEGILRGLKPRLLRSVITSTVPSSAPKVDWRNMPISLTTSTCLRFSWWMFQERVRARRNGWEPPTVRFLTNQG
jgi:hypothetical protein